MSMAAFAAQRRLERHAIPVADSRRECASVDEAWMLLACQGSAVIAQVVTHSGRQAREPHIGHRDSAARRKRHPAVVSRMRAAQRFSGPERRDVPHA